MGLKFKKTSVKLQDKEICFKNKCGKQPIKAIQKSLVSYEVDFNGEKELLVVGKDKDNYLTSVLYDKNMKIKKETDSKTYTDYTRYSKSVLNSRKKFSQEGDIGKARVSYQILQDWGY